ncbi:MAG: hypothetical protein JWM21_3062 [Acidobacteria bacterium]|nr:hypothetical protein [Acidobacteriota bacterium]
MVPGISVTEHWQHYLLESAGHEEARRADETGEVDFPARTIRASIISRAIDWLTNIAREGAKARVDPYASLVVWGSQVHETAVATYTPGTPPQSEVVVHRR